VPDPDRRVLQIKAPNRRPRLIGVRSTEGLTSYDLRRGSLELFDERDQVRTASDVEEQAAFQELIHTWEATRAAEPR
jgi:hypothetical protein